MQPRARAGVGATRRPAHRTRLSAFALAVLALGLSRVARADPLHGVTVHWDGPESCSEEGELRAEARRLLPADGSYEPTAIDIVVTERADGPGYRMQFSARSASRSAARELLLSSCEETRQAGALLVALTLDPEGVAAAEPKPGAAPADPGPPARAPAPAIPPAAASPRASRPSPRAASRPRDAGDDAVRLAVELSAGALADSAVLPAFAVGPIAAVGLRVSGLRLALAGLYLPGAEQNIAGSDDGRVRATLWAGQLEACYSWRLTRFEFGPCAGGELGRYSAGSTGVAHPSEEAASWAAVSAGASAALSLGGGIALFATGAALLPLRRPVLWLSDSGPAYSVPQVSLRIAFGVRWSSDGR